ncbi:GDP-Man:Man(1)GlcNAc(2)-PP-dolichol alpha-1,3-mannosyltransferase [Sporobolomyces salmoneus]|uniref:GDP-Man:Man(1)GlcNAc(2)-PP-dolichol alpha-1,3-mannosyltransferase n=1 Tax=Sporobolomyces salmoneus TaxID=183962 RepID=UPI0031794DAA
MFPSDEAPTWAQQQAAYPPLELPPTLRVAFIHPDLGLGGAERLVVDAALELKKRGHDVEIFTSYHEDWKSGRSFEETRNGSLKVHVLGNSIFPRSFFGSFTIICAILRQLHLAAQFLLAQAFFHLSSTLLFRAFVLPNDIPFISSNDWSIRRQLEPFDVIVVDQLSTAVPFLRWWGFNRVVFYCHFPDQLLAPGSNFVPDPRGPRGFSLKGEITAFYRIPVDHVEMMTTGEADKILVNSDFTSEIFTKTFKELNRIPRTVYPAVDPEAYAKKVEAKSEDQWLVSDTPTLLSINRFEGKKNVGLAVEAFAKVLKEHPTLRLIIAGGFDPRLADNVLTLGNLQKLAAKLQISQHTYSPSPITTSSMAASVTPRNRPTISDKAPSASDFPQILFLLNMTSDQKSYLLSAESNIALLYTPMYEHFGIVPLEAMASGLPVIATTSGGPTETIVDNGLPAPGEEDDEPSQTKLTTGLLRPAKVDNWARAISSLLSLSPSQRQAIGQAGRERVKTQFSRERLGQSLEKACQDAASVGYPIPYENGFKKMIAFFLLAWICAACGIGAFVLGLYWY